MSDVVADAMPDEIMVTRCDAVTILTLNRPKQMNAVNAAMHEGLARVWSAIAGDATTRAVVLTGAGGAFSAGGDRDFIRAQHEDPLLRRGVMRQAETLIRELLRCPVPVVAAVNGPAVGLGCSLVLMSDLLVMSDDAYLQDPHVAVGLTAADGGAVVLPALVGMSRAKEFLLLGDRLSADQAAQWGLVNRVALAGTCGDEALLLAQRLADLPEHAARSTKRALNSQVERAAAGMLDFALLAEYSDFDDPEHHAAVRR